MKGTNDGSGDGDSYRVFLLRLWRSNHGPWHASLHAADAAAPQRFADISGLLAFLQDIASIAPALVVAEPPASTPSSAQAPATTNEPGPGAQGS